MGNQMSNYDLALGFLQVFDVLLNLDQVSNDTILEELQKQDKEYLEKITRGLKLIGATAEENAREIKEIKTIMSEIIDNEKRIVDQIIDNNEQILQILKALARGH